MYTLRIFKDVKEIDRSHFCLGNHYKVLGPEKGDEENNIVLRIHGAPNTSPEDGFAIHKDYHAFIMNSTGGTFETLSKPKHTPILESSDIKHPIEGTEN